MQLKHVLQFETYLTPGGVGAGVDVAVGEDSELSFSPVGEASWEDVVSSTLEPYGLSRELSLEEQGEIIEIIRGLEGAQDRLREYLGAAPNKEELKAV